MILKKVLLCKTQLLEYYKLVFNVQSKLFSISNSLSCSKENKVDEKKSVDASDNFKNNGYSHPQMHEQDPLDRYPEEIRYRKRYKDPLARTWGIIKDDILEMIGKVQHLPLITGKKSSSAEFEHFKRQIFPEHCDVVVIGGGLAGVACAYYLQEATKDGLRIAVIEKDLTVSYNR